MKLSAVYFEELSTSLADFARALFVIIFHHLHAAVMCLSHMLHYGGARSVKALFVTRFAAIARNTKVSKMETEISFTLLKLSAC